MGKEIISIASFTEFSLRVAFKDLAAPFQARNRWKLLQEPPTSQFFCQKGRKTQNLTVSHGWKCFCSFITTRGEASCKCPLLSLEISWSPTSKKSKNSSADGHFIFRAWQNSVFKPTGASLTTLFSLLCIWLWVIFFPPESFALGMKAFLSQNLSLNIYIYKRIHGWLCINNLSLQFKDF